MLKIYWFELRFYKNNVLIFNYLKDIVTTQSVEFLLQFKANSDNISIVVIF